MRKNNSNVNIREAFYLSVALIIFYAILGLGLVSFNREAVTAKGNTADTALIEAFNQGYDVGALCGEKIGYKHCMGLLGEVSE